MALLDGLRKKAAARILIATMEELGLLPGWVLDLDIEPAPTEGKKRFRRRKKMAPGNEMTPSDGVRLRAALEGLTKGTPEYQAVWQKFSRDNDWADRQMSAAVSGKDRKMPRRVQADAAPAD